MNNSVVATTGLDGVRSIFRGFMDIIGLPRVVLPHFVALTTVTAFQPSAASVHLGIFATGIGDGQRFKFRWDSGVLCLPQPWHFCI